jgi:hypothetical protein
MNALVNLAVLYARLGCPRRARDLLAFVIGHEASQEDAREKARRLAGELGLS